MSHLCSSTVKTPHFKLTSMWGNVCSLTVYYFDEKWKREIHMYNLVQLKSKKSNKFLNCWLFFFLWLVRSKLAENDIFSFFLHLGKGNLLHGLGPRISAINMKRLRQEYYFIGTYLLDLMYLNSAIAGRLHIGQFWLNIEG